jgi:hypothetical protein
MAERGESRELVTIPPAGAPALMPAATLIVLRQTPNTAFAAEDFSRPPSGTNTPRGPTAASPAASSHGATVASSSCDISRPASPANTSVSSRARRRPRTRRSPQVFLRRPGPASRGRPQLLPRCAASNAASPEAGWPSSPSNRRASCSDRTIPVMWWGSSNGQCPACWPTTGARIGVAAARMGEEPKGSPLPRGRR